MGGRRRESPLLGQSTSANSAMILGRTFRISRSTRRLRAEGQCFLRRGSSTGRPAAPAAGLIAQQHLARLIVDVAEFVDLEGVRAGDGRVQRAAQLVGELEGLIEVEAI